MKTKRKVNLDVVVSSYGLDIEENTVYVDEEKQYFALRCLGCGQFMHYPYNPENGWSLNIGDKGVTIKPSILNHCCEAHYIITNGVANIV